MMLQGVDGELTGDSISFWESFLFDLTSSLFIFWVMMIQIIEQFGLSPS